MSGGRGINLFTTAATHLDPIIGRNHYRGEKSIFIKSHLVTPYGENVISPPHNWRFILREDWMSYCSVRIFD